MKERDAKIIELEKKCDSLIVQIKKDYMDEITEYATKIYDTESAEKLENEMIKVIEDAYSKANKQEYIDKVELNIQIKVYIDRIAVDIQEGLGKNLSSGNLKNNLAKQQIVYEHLLIKKLTAVEHADALALVLAKRVKTNLLRKNELCIINEICDGYKIQISYIRPNENFCAYSGW